MRGKRCAGAYSNLRAICYGVLIPEPGEQACAQQNQKTRGRLRHDDAFAKPLLKIRPTEAQFPLPNAARRNILRVDARPCVSLRVPACRTTSLETRRIETSKIHDTTFPMANYPSTTETEDTAAPEPLATRHPRRLLAPLELKLRNSSLLRISDFGFGVPSTCPSVVRMLLR